MLSSALQGFAASLALIVAIGAQNAYVLRQGLARRHVLPVVLVCAVSDIVLIAVGVGGVATAVSASPVLLAAARWGGALFLAGYALLALRRAWRPGALQAAAGSVATRRAAILAALGFTWLNPHCWLDTVVLLGSLATQAEHRAAFGAGAMLASVIWFFALGYGARVLAPWFARPVSWRVLDATIAVVMATIAATLVT